MLRSSLLAMAAMLVAGSATAEPRRALAMARVELADLDLNSAAGAAAGLHRIELAARQICAFTRSPLFPDAAGRAWRCRREAVAAAVARLRTPALTLAHADWLSADPTAEPPSPRYR